MNIDDYEGHTPAPWVNEYDEELGEHIIESGDGMVAQRVLGVDADLITAAPELLAIVIEVTPPTPYNLDDEHLSYDRSEWIGEVMSKHTQLGYWAWVNHQLDIEQEEEE